MNAWPVVVLKRFFKSRSSPAVSAGKAEDRWSSMARSIARRIRSGTFVGPGTNRKLRPAMAVVLEERGSGRCASGGLAPKLSRQSYFDLPTPQLHERVGVACLTGGGAWAAVAAAAVLQRLPEVGEQHAAPANGAGDVGSHLRRVLGPREVSRAPEDQAERRPAIPPRPAGLLVIGFERARHPPVQHLAHVRLVDAHAERARRDHHRHPVAQEVEQDFAPRCGAEPRVIGGGPDTHAEQRPGHELGETAGRCVDEGVPGDVADQTADAREPGPVVAHALDRKGEVRPVERCHHHRRFPQAQHLQYFGARGGRPAPPERQGGRGLQEIAVSPQPAGHRPKLVPPLDDAVRFVDREQRDRAARPPQGSQDRKSTRLNSSHSQISYAVFCLKKKKKKRNITHFIQYRFYNTTALTSDLQYTLIE